MKTSLLAQSQMSDYLTWGLSAAGLVIVLVMAMVILAFGLFPYDPRMVRIAGVFVAAGWLIGLFQLLVIAGVIPESIQPCVQGIPCSDTHVDLFGFLNIPTLSFLTFTLIGALLYFAHRTETP